MEKKSNPEQIIRENHSLDVLFSRKLIFSDFMRVGEEWLEENPHEYTIFFIPAD